MKTINVRELKRNLKSIFPLPEDGVRVEYRDGTDFYIYPTPKGDVIHTGTIPLENVIQEEPEEKPTISAWCLINVAHPFVASKNYPCHLISWEDEHGSMLIKNKTACLDCIEYYKNMGRGKLIFI